MDFEKTKKNKMKHLYFSSTKLKNKKGRRISNYIVYLFFFFICLFSNCKEDTIDPDVFGSLTGQVLLELDNSPIDGAIISTTPATSTVQSNSDGSFVFENIKVGSYTIRAEFPDLASNVQTITINENETSSVVILMSEPQVENTPPTNPQIISPPDGALNQPVSIELNWESTDINENDILIYDVCIFSGDLDSDTIKINGTTENMINVSNLRYGTTYFWQVSVNDGTADPIFSEVWKFNTAELPPHQFAFSRIFDGIYEVYSGNTPNEIYQLTFDGSNFRPRFSPLGNRIAYIHSNSPIKRLFTMNRNGSNQMEVELPVPIDAENPFELDFCWSPDGTQLLYMNEERLFKVNIDGTGPELIAELNTGEEFIEVDWNGPSGKIAARTVGDLPYESRILLFEENGTFIEELIPDVPGSIGGPSFSIEGDYLLYTRDTTGFESIDGRQLESHIFLHEIATGIDQDLSEEKPLGFNDFDARFSPNGAFIVFVQTNNVPNSQKDIHLMNINGGGRTLLFENSEMPDWFQ